MEVNRKKYEVLNGLPAYGPMYVPVTQYDGTFISTYSEGFAVRFFTSDGNSWTANFSLGMTVFSTVIDFPDTDLTIVVAGGSGYLMNRDQHKPINTFSVTIKAALLTDAQEVIMADSTHVTIINFKGQIWSSERLSWDGIEDLRVEGNMLHGTAYVPTHETEDWVAFTIDLETRQRSGGGWLMP